MVHARRRRRPRSSGHHSSTLSGSRGFAGGDGRAPTSRTVSAQPRALRDRALRRRRLNVCAALFLLHLPAFALALTGNGKSGDTALLLMLPFFATVLVGMVCWVIYLLDIAKDPQLTSNQRVGWIVGLIVLPQVLFVYWWVHVRGRIAAAG